MKETDIVFLGDSLTESFDLQKHFGRRDLRNRGVSGDMTQHLLYRLEEITNASPSVIFLMIGINDIYQGVSVETLISNIEIIIVNILEKSPKSKLIVQSILPVNASRLFADKNINTDVYRANNLLQKICNEKSLIFINLYPDFLNDKGEMDSCYTYDGVHLSEQGYILWAELIQSYL
ncbi:MAG: hypothetical protein K8R68_04585 [Bacteroidales bacterium]|nr:hypothetical protein [Bacteroidales bacterium]